MSRRRHSDGGSGSANSQPSESRRMMERCHGTNRLELVKRQYSERRRLLADDLQREAAFIQNLETRLLELKRGKANKPPHGATDVQRGEQQATSPAQGPAKSPTDLRSACAAPASARRSLVAIRDDQMQAAAASPAFSVITRAALEDECVDLRSLSVREVGRMLQANHLGLYERLFIENGVDGPMLADSTLSDADLHEVGVRIRLHRKRLLGLVEGYRHHGVPTRDLRDLPISHDVLSTPVRLRPAVPGQPAALPLPPHLRTRVARASPLTVATSHPTPTRTSVRQGARRERNGPTPAPCPPSTGPASTPSDVASRLLYETEDEESSAGFHSDFEECDEIESELLLM